jgi:MarR family transcriptional regulator for hemolysin
VTRTLFRYDFERSLGWWVCRASHAFERALNDELAPHGITMRQAQVLALLAEAGELSQHEVAKRLGIEAPTVAGVLHRMERAGWIARVACPGDARKKLVRPAPRGRPVWDRIARCGRRLRDRAARGLGDREILRLCAALEAIERNLTR